MEIIDGPQALEGHAEAGKGVGDGGAHPADEGRRAKEADGLGRGDQAVGDGGVDVGDAGEVEDQAVGALASVSASTTISTTAPSERLVSQSTLAAMTSVAARRMTTIAIERNRRGESALEAEGSKFCIGGSDG